MSEVFWLFGGVAADVVDLVYLYQVVDRRTRSSNFSMAILLMQLIVLKYIVVIWFMACLGAFG